MSTFGRTTIGGSTVALFPDKVTLSRFAKPKAGVLSKLTVRIKEGAGTTAVKLRAVVYTDVAGKPGTLIAEGTEVEYHHGDGDQWINLPLPALPDVLGTHVHIGWNFGGGTNTALFAYDETGAPEDHHFLPREYALGAPEAWPTSEGGFDAKAFSVYATYTVDPTTITAHAAVTTTAGIPINPVQLRGVNVNTWTASGLPAGVSVASSAGSITGAPETPGTYTVSVEAHGDSNNASSSFTWTVVSVPVARTWRGYTAFSPFPGTARLGSASSPFNALVGPSPVVLANSAAMVSWLLATNEGGFGVAHTANQFPTVFARDDDPLVLILDKEQRFYHEKRIRIPAAAKCQRNNDKHLQVVLCPSDCAALGLPEGSTADFWQVGDVAQNGSEVVPYEAGGTQLRVSSSGVGGFLGDLILTGHSVAANFDLNAGTIRGPELLAGSIGHALVAVVNDTQKYPNFVYPASGADGTSTDPNAAKCGQRFYLAASEAEILAAALPHPFLVGVAKALATYGFYIEDTGSSRIGLRTDNDNQYTAFGAPGYMATVAEAQELEPDDEGVLIDYSPLNVLASKLRAIAPPTIAAPEVAAPYNHADRFPPGTPVSAFPVGNRHGDERPAGDPVQSVVADSAGGLPFVLAPGEYVLYGEVAGEGRAMVLAVRTPEVVPPSLHKRLQPARDAVAV